MSPLRPGTRAETPRSRETNLGNVFARYQRERNEQRRPCETVATGGGKPVPLAPRRVPPRHQTLTPRPLPEPQEGNKEQEDIGGRDLGVSQPTGSTQSRDLGVTQAKVPHAVPGTWACCKPSGSTQFHEAWARHEPPGSAQPQEPGRAAVTRPPRGSRSLGTSTTRSVQLHQRFSMGGHPANATSHTWSAAIQEAAGPRRPFSQSVVRPATQEAGQAIRTLDCNGWMTRKAGSAWNTIPPSCLGVSTRSTQLHRTPKVARHHE